MRPYSTMRLFLIVLLFALITPATMLGQDVAPLPSDPRVKTGKLANGLTYYLFKNTGVKGHADFILAQKIGENVEDENQKGMLKMLELLSLRGTRNFPDSTITTYLLGLGLSPKDIQFNTGANNTVYSINNVPITNSNVTDSTLLILYNWMSSINIDEEDIESAETLYNNKVRNFWTAENRTLFKSYQDFLIEESKEAEQKPWTKTPHFTSKELRNFYYQWFRPDLQAIIVCGDIDTASVRTRITSLFSTVPKPLSKRPEAKKLTVDRSNFISLQKDKEYNRVSVSIDFIKTALPAKYKKTSVPFIQEFMTSSILGLLASRISDGIIKNNLPIWNVECRTKETPYSTNENVISVSYETLPNNIYSTLSFLSSEIDRMAKFGFNGQELLKSKDIYYRDIEMLYDNRFSQPNSIFSKRLLDNYLYGYSLASIELKFEIMREIVYSITQTQLNDYAKALLGNKDNFRIVCKVPDSPSLDNISKERLYSTFKETLATAAPERVEKETVRWPQITYRETGIAVEERTDPLTGAREFYLPNGVTVVFKQTTDSKDTISVRAVSKGGFSMMDGITLSNEKYMNDLVNIGGLATVSRSELERLYRYNNMEMKAVIKQNKEMVYGYAPANKTEELFTALYLNFANRRKDDTEFVMYKKTKIFEAEYDMLSPTHLFADSIAYYNNSNKRYVGKVTQEDIAALNYNRIFAQINKRFANAADFVFIFTGNIDPAIIKDLSVKYLSNLKGDADARESGVIVPNYLTKGKVSKHFFAEMVVPRCYLNITNSAGCDFNIRNYAMSNICGTYIKAAIERSPVRNITTDVTTISEIINYPEQIFVLNTNFVADSTDIFEIKKIYTGIFRNILKEGIDFSLFDLALDKAKQNFRQVCNTNRYWLDVLENRMLYNIDFNRDYLSVLENITSKEFNDFMGNLVTKGNCIELLMEGTVDDVKTKTLFREDEFIRNFFGY